MRQNILKLIRSRLFWLSVGILSLGMAVGFTTIWKETLDKLKTGKDDKKLAADKAAVINRIGKAEKKLTAFQPMFSKAQDASWLIEEVSRLAEETGVVLTSVTPDYAATGIDAYRKVSLRISTRCSYHQLGAFVSRIEGDPTFIKVQSLQINASREVVAGRKPVDVEISVCVFYLTGLI